MRVTKLERTATAILATGALALASAIPATAQEAEQEFVLGQNTIEELCEWVRDDIVSAVDTDVTTEDPAVDTDVTTEDPAVDTDMEMGLDRGMIRVDPALLRELCFRANMLPQTNGIEAPTDVDPSPMPDIEADFEVDLEATEGNEG